MFPSLFSGFNRAVRAMQHSQHAMTVHSTNIANASDPTYTRKTVLPPADNTPSSPGIARLRDSFLDMQYRQSAGSLGEAAARRSVLTKVEDIFGDPVEGGLRQSIDQFFDAWKALAEHPADGVARLQVLSAGKLFAHQIQQTYGRLDALEQTINEELVIRVQEANYQLERVFELNRRISDLVRHRAPDADLRDQRDRALDELAKLTGATSTEQPDGTVRVVLGSHLLLDGPVLSKLSLRMVDHKPYPVLAGQPEAPLSGGGTIGGLVSGRENEIRSMKSEVDNLGKSVARAINEQHMLGKGLGGQAGRPFFAIQDGVPAGIEVSRDLRPEDVAVGGVDGQGHPSDGRNAREIARLSDQALLTSGLVPGQAQSPRAFYRNLVGWVGMAARNATVAEEMSSTHVRIGEQQRQSEWGVSLDEEVAHLTMEQKAFAAAARMISVMDEVLDTLINRTGR